MNNDCTYLDWRPVLLVKVIRLPFADTAIGLSVKRLYQAQHPDGIVQADWTLPADERFYPLVQLVGWKPHRDVPFNPPIKFQHLGDPRVVSLIPSGTWILPYDDQQYRLYERMQTVLHLTLEQIDTDPLAPETLKLLIRWTM